MMLHQISNFNTLIGQFSDKPVDLVPNCRALEADIVSKFGFGKSIGAIESLKSGQKLQIVEENDHKSTQMSLWADEQLTAAMDPKRNTELSFLGVMAGSRFPAQSALSEAKEMLGPGTDTTSATLAHILWALSLDRAFQEDLVSELESSNWPTDMTELESLPKLVACVKEGIRWTGAAAAMLPRIVPKGGCELEGIYVPGGTMVSSSPIWYLRDEDAFPEPDLYRPSRWLAKDQHAVAPLNKEYYIPFSRGPNVCIGIHFAYLELFLSVSQILKLYRLEPVDKLAMNTNIEAILPPRLEFVAAIPKCSLRVILQDRYPKRPSE
ncbi:hypothetical protein N7495_000051 [Penicillium taxi]|uniref:uncharacterized protein n=1 Tax=Penicillium taxi TaxID=168475 RepID=UPI0025458EC2|nr:uncharacterized protein N7495_000051 [Penicillium taxi]KAJ5907369.1 hypothetical protein N7495_000051 [Penicillium taxi]